jgi:glycosyltransferase involved in cell wall biosynthesis
MVPSKIDSSLKATAHHGPPSECCSLEVSVVMACLNEADTLEACIKKSQCALGEHHIKGEIIVADNGSTDGSQDIATRMGARVIHVSSKGYGSALMGGFAAARGRLIIMGDADDSYDFLEIPKFVDKLREGFDLVQGCRLPSGGGTVLPGDAMVAPMVGQPHVFQNGAMDVPRADPRCVLWDAWLHERTL